MLGGRGVVTQFLRDKAGFPGKDAEPCTLTTSSCSGFIETEPIGNRTVTNGLLNALVSSLVVISIVCFLPKCTPVSLIL